MAHPFGELLWTYIRSKKGLSQNKLAMDINQDPAVISRMAMGKALTGPQSRERVVQIIGWLHKQGVLEYLEEANTLLAAADKPGLTTESPLEASLIQSLQIQSTLPVESLSTVSAIEPEPQVGFMDQYEVQENAFREVRVILRNLKVLTRISMSRVNNSLWLRSCLVGHELRQKPYVSRNRALYQVFTSVLNLMRDNPSDRAGLYADLLFLRYWRGHSVEQTAELLKQATANPPELSNRSLYYLQHEAIELFTLLLMEQEQLCSFSTPR